MTSPSGAWYFPVPDANTAPPTISYNGQIFSRSAPTSPFQNTVYLSPSPHIQPIPLPGQPAPIWIPSPGPGAHANLAPPPAFPNAVPVLLDFLNPRAQHHAHSGMPTMYYDLRDGPNRACIKNLRGHLELLSNVHLRAPVTNPPSKKMKIISRLFPWEIDIVADEEGGPVTVEDLIKGIHEALWKHIAPSEWWIVTDDARKKASAAYGKNCDESSAGPKGKHAPINKPRHKKEGVRRIDWLLERVIMLGLERDETFVATRVTDKDDQHDTWVLIIKAP